MTRRRWLAVATAGVLAVAGLLVGLLWPTGEGGHDGGRSVALAPLTQPVTSGGPSVANFCAVLRADTGHLQELGQARTSAQIRQVLAQYVAAAPAVAAEAPPPIASPARLYVAETTAVYGAVVRSNLGRGAVTASVLQPFATPAAKAAPNQVRSYAQAHCGFDVFDPASAAGS